MQVGSTLTAFLRPCISGSKAFSRCNQIIALTGSVCPRAVFKLFSHAQHRGHPTECRHFGLRSPSSRPVGMSMLRDLHTQGNDWHVGKASLSMSLAFSCEVMSVKMGQPKAGCWMPEADPTVESKARLALLCIFVQHSGVS